MQYYFFKTMTIDGRERLRAFPGQKMVDGTFIDTTLNVQAPKESANYAGGTRNEYPIGTVFASSIIRETTNKGSGLKFYTVYDALHNIDFHPVESSKPIENEHKNEEMIAAWELFRAGITMDENDTPETAPTKENKPVTSSTNGKTLLDNIKSIKAYSAPSDREGFHVEKEQWYLLLANLHRGRPTMLTGPSGCGKTEIIKLLCEKTGTPLTLIPMGGIDDPVSQLVGKLDLDPETGGTVFDWADFAQAIQKPGVVLLDEVNRIPRNGENILFSCLDSSRVLPAFGAKGADRRMIPVHPGCVFFATANIGSEYTGTKQIDKALQTRFMPVEMDFLDVTTEQNILITRTGIEDDDAYNIALIASRIRLKAQNGELQTNVSTRETLRAAELVKDGFDTLTALELTFLPLFDNGDAYGGTDGSERATVKQIIAQRCTA